MNGYVSKLRQRFSHRMPKVPQHSPYKAPEKVYGIVAQDTIAPDDTAKLDDEQIKLAQQVIRVYLYYGRAVDNTILPALSAIASKYSNGTKRMMAKTIQLFDYPATQMNGNIFVLCGILKIVVCSAAEAGMVHSS